MNTSRYRILASFFCASIAACVGPGADGAPPEIADPSSAISQIAAAPITVAIPVTAPSVEDLDNQAGHAAPQYAKSSRESAGAQHHLVAYIPISGIPIGSTLVDLKANIENTPGDGCFFAFYDQFHGQFRDSTGAALPIWAPEAWFSIPTPAPASWQSITLQQPFSWTIQSGHAYSIVMHFGSSGPCFMEALEATYIPAA